MLWGPNMNALSEQPSTEGLGDAPRKGCDLLCRNLHLGDIGLPANEACGDSKDWLEKQHNGICT